MLYSLKFSLSNELTVCQCMVYFSVAYVGISIYITPLPSSDYTMEEGVLVTQVKSEHKEDPEFGPTAYRVTVKHTPDVKRGGRWRGAARQNEPKIPFELKCVCPDFNGMCKHVAAVCVVHF